MFGDCIGKIIEMPIHYKRNIIIMNATKNDKREMLRKKTQNLVKKYFHKELHAKRTRHVGREIRISHQNKSIRMIINAKTVLIKFLLNDSWK